MWVRCICVFSKVREQALQGNDDETVGREEDPAADVALSVVAVTMIVARRWEGCTPGLWANVLRVRQVYKERGRGWEN